jgi:uncharacterized protein YkwD
MICYKYLWIFLFIAVDMLGSTFSPGKIQASSEEDVKYSDVLREMGKYSCLSPKEAELVRLINIYRQSNGLPPIAISRSLTKVARIHVLDLYRNSPATGQDGRGLDCSLHSWSDHGYWTPVCYTLDHYYAEELWDKPRQITHGTYYRVGYENAYWTSESEVTPSRVLESWKKTPDHNTLILEAGKWRRCRLVALGVGIYKNYAVIWVGNMLDPLGSLKSCKYAN